MSTFCTFETEQRLTELINLFGVYHYDAHGATAECADLFGSPIYSSDKALAMVGRFGRSRSLRSALRSSFQVHSGSMAERKLRRGDHSPSAFDVSPRQLN